MSFVTMGIGIPFKKGGAASIIMPPENVVVVDEGVVAVLEDVSPSAALPEVVVVSVQETEVIASVQETEVVCAVVENDPIIAVFDCADRTDPNIIPDLEAWLDFSSSSHVNEGSPTVTDRILRLLERSGFDRHVYAPQNLYKHSEDFSLWEQLGAINSVTGGQSDPDGGSDAWRVDFGSGSTIRPDGNTNGFVAFESIEPSFWMRKVSGGLVNDSFNFVQVPGQGKWDIQLPDIPTSWTYFDSQNLGAFVETTAFQAGDAGQTRIRFSSNNAVVCDFYRPQVAKYRLAPYVAMAASAVTGGPTWEAVSGVGGVGRFSNGANEWLEAIFNELPQPLTIIVELKINSVPGSTNYILDGQDPAEAESLLAYNATNRLANFGSQQTFGTYNTTDYDNVALICNGASSYMRVNGVDVNNPIDIGANGIAGLKVGWDADGTLGRVLDGDIHRILVYSRILTDAQLDFLNA